MQVPVVVNTPKQMFLKIIDKWITLHVPTAFMYALFVVLNIPWTSEMESYINVPSVPMKAKLNVFYPSHPRIQYLDALLSFHQLQRIDIRKVILAVRNVTPTQHATITTQNEVSMITLTMI